jgi:hypothetical protein
MASMGMLPTPQAADGGKLGGNENQDSLTKRARLETGVPSQLNPQFVLEMMGFPPDWTELPVPSGVNRSITIINKRCPMGQQFWGYFVPIYILS